MVDPPSGPSLGLSVPWARGEGMSKRRSRPRRAGFAKHADAAHAAWVTARRFYFVEPLVDDGAPVPMPGVTVAPELPLVRSPPPDEVPDDEPIAAARHSGIAFSSSVVLVRRNASRVVSQLNWSTGSATSWPPTPSTPPDFTTRRSIDLLCGFISTV